MADMTSIPRYRILLAGTFPPPFGGQNITLLRRFKVLSTIDDYKVEHWRFCFTTHLKDTRGVRWSKLIGFVKTVSNLIILRLKGRINAAIYPAGGPHTSAVMRDILLLPFALLLCQRVVISFHAAGIAERLSGLNGVLRWFLINLYKNAHSAISLTNFGRSDPKSVGMARIYTIPNAIEDKNEEGHCVEKPRDVHRFLYIGHLCRDKGVDVLIKAFADVSRDRPSIELAIVGDFLPPFDREWLDELIDSTGMPGRISYKGAMSAEDALLQYRLADVVIFPSVAPYESFGMILIEAMMMGRVIIASDWRGAREVLTPDFGGVCYGIGSNHVESLSKAIRDCLDKDACWPGLAANNRRIFLERYTIDVLRQNLASSLSDILAN
jgi:glycosyltransferase involved in cell wall biosynthesis